MNKFVKSILTEVYNYYIPMLDEAKAMAQDIYNQHYEDKLTWEDFLKVVQTDPTSKLIDDQYTKGTYVPWLMAHYEPDYYNQRALNRELKSALTILNEISNGKKLYKPEQFISDINQYKNYDQLVNTMQTMGQQSFELKSQNTPVASINGFPEFKIIPSLCEVVFQGNIWTVVTPKNQRGAIYYGKHTNWCTAASGNNARDDWYHKYLNEYGGQYYICFNSATHKRFQLHFEQRMFCDEKDNVIYNWPEMGDDGELKQFFSSISQDTDKLGCALNFENFDEFIRNEYHGDIYTFRLSQWGEDENSPATYEEIGYGFVIFTYDGDDDTAYYLGKDGCHDVIRLDNDDDSVLLIPITSSNGGNYCIAVAKEYNDYNYYFLDNDMEWSSESAIKILDADTRNRILTLNLGNNYEIEIDADALGNDDVYEFLEYQNQDEFGFPGTGGDYSINCGIYYNMDNLNIYRFKYDAVEQSISDYLHNTGHPINDDNIWDMVEPEVIKNFMMQDAEKILSIKDKVKYLKIVDRKYQI